MTAEFTLGSLPRGAVAPGKIFGRRIPLGGSAATPLTIVEHPQSATTTPAGIVTMHCVAAGGIPPYHYAWLADTDSNIAGARLLNVASAPYADVAAPQQPDGSFWVWCVVTDYRGVTVASHAAKLTSSAGLNVTKQPASVSVAIAAQAVLTIEAAGGAPPYTYQWFELAADGSSTALAGATSASYSATTSSAGTRRYFCQVKDSTGTKVASQVATVTVGAALTVVAQPQSQTIASGTTAQLSIIVQGGISPYSYQWHTGTAGTIAPIDGARNQVFTTPVLTAGASYWVQVKDSAGQTINSATATISIATGALYISTQPQSQTVPAGQSAVLGVVATNGSQPYHYQWYKIVSGAGVLISGATAAAYTVAGQAAGTTVEYYVVVTDSASPTPATATSARAAVIIAGTLKIDTHPISQTVTVGSSVGLSVAASGGVGTLSYQWQGSDDHVTWSDLAGMTSAGITLTWFTAAGTFYYRCVVKDTGGSTVTSDMATITVTAAFLFTLQPQPAVVTVGSSATFTVEAKGGAAPITYQWYMEQVTSAADGAADARNTRGVDYGTPDDFEADYAYATKDTW